MKRETMERKEDREEEIFIESEKELKYLTEVKEKAARNLMPIYREG